MAAGKLLRKSMAILLISLMLLSIISGAAFTEDFSQGDEDCPLCEEDSSQGEFEDDGSITHPGDTELPFVDETASKKDAAMIEEDVELTPFAETSFSSLIDMSDDTVADGTSGDGWTFNNDVYTIHSGAAVTVVGYNQLPSPSQRRILVDFGATDVTITLNNVNIISNDNPLRLSDNVSATLILEGENALTALSITGTEIHTTNSTLTIEGNGSLTTIGCGILFSDSVGTMYGDVTITSDMTIPAEHTLTIKANQTLTISQGITLTNNGTIVNNGKIINNGIIIHNGEIITPKAVQELTLTGGNLDVDYTYINDVLTIMKDGTYIISMADGIATTAHRVVVQSGVKAEVTLDNVNIDVSELMNIPAFEMANATVVLTLNNNNELRGGHQGAALHVPIGSTLTIMGNGRLVAIGGEHSAGIGNGYIEELTDVNHVGNITITGGAVTAIGGSFSAGIGDGYKNHNDSRNHGGKITITGGAVTAIGGQFGAGIGGSIYSNCDIIITGGTVTAQGGEFGAGIGGGFFGHGGLITIDGNAQVVATGGEWGAGIGGGVHGHGGEININGGTVAAYGGFGAAGIGGGEWGAGGTITITGGTVTAIGDEGGAGIGGGWHNNHGSEIAISGGNITAKGGSADTAAIGRGLDGESANVSIEGFWNFWINESNTADGATAGSGLFTCSDVYSYIKLVELTPIQGGDNPSYTSPPVPDTDIPNTISPPRRIIPFIDVFESDWFVDAVMYAYERGLMIGTSTEPMMFSPHMELTRGMAATVPYRHAGSPGAIGLIDPFTDVPANKWFTDAVVWAADKGIVLGFGDGRFAPRDIVTRQDLAAILNRYVVFAGIELPVIRDYTGFNDDADIANYAKEAVEKFYCAGIINGKPGNMFDPQGHTTRAEFATIIMNLSVFHLPNN